jgi:hypothetical protein
MTTVQQREEYRQANPEAARIIASDPVLYPPESLPGIWAKMVLNPLKGRTTPADRDPIQPERKTTDVECRHQHSDSMG